MKRVWTIAVLTLLVVVNAELGLSKGATLPPPGVVTSPASSVTTTSAVLNGSANPNQSLTTGWFRISTTNPGTCNDSFGTRIPAINGASLGAGMSPVTYSFTASSLTSGTTYYFCALASNSVGTSFGQVFAFTTLGGPPTVSTNAASDVTDASVTLKALANPNGLEATGWFRYSTTSPGACNDTFGIRAPASGGTSLGSGSSNVTYFEQIAGLAPGTTYFYCGIDQNSSGTSFGNLVQFTTLTVPQTAFSYQGRLTNAGGAANGNFDFIFKLYPAASVGAQIGSDSVQNDVAVIGGIFTVPLDFGTAPFTGDMAKFLEIWVRPGDQTGAYTQLLPRVPLGAAPYSVKAIRAATAASVQALSDEVLRLQQQVEQQQKTIQDQQEKLRSLQSLICELRPTAAACQDQER